MISSCRNLLSTHNLDIGFPLKFNLNVQIIQNYKLRINPYIKK